VDAFIVCVIGISVFLLDQASKIFVLRELKLNESMEVIKNIFYFTLVHNTGAAFGILKGQTFFFIILSILAVTTIAIYIRKSLNARLVVKIALGLILGGALGNLVDRLRFGHVIDFLDFRIWPVFNIADSAITVGASLLIIGLFKKTKTGL